MEILYLIYVLVFIIGSIAGLLLSYKKHMEPFIISEIDVVYLVLAIIGWFLFLNFPLLSFIPSFIAISIGLFLIGLVIGARPGYGRKETVIGAIISISIYLVFHFLI
ncbi:MAG: DUF2104 domain-containing protein [archaeon]|nr:DUF2104 domain-containing protein [archaeon]